MIIPSRETIAAPARRAFARDAAALALAGALPLRALAQMRVDVSGVGASQIPVAIPPFAGTPLPIDLATLVRNDLKRSGAFRLIDDASPLDAASTPDFAALRSRGIDAIVGTTAARLPDGRFEIRFRLHDTAGSKSIGGLVLPGSASELRMIGHRMADHIFEKLTGERGIFSTRIAFVAKDGGRWRLQVADWDGENVQTALSSSEPILSPRWSPDGTRLAYVSFETRKPVVFVQTLATEKRVAVANFRGSNSAPAWSPDGRQLAVALSREGNTQLYVVSADGGGPPRRVATSAYIDTEPAWSPDGGTIWFTSDRAGGPQVFRVPASGGDPVRVTFNGPWHTSPRPSPDGRLLAYVARRDGRYVVAVRDLGSNAETIVSDSDRAESPSFSPNGRWLLYASRGTVTAVTTDGRVRQRLSIPGADVREPTWGPFPPSAAPASP